jgi:alkylmercury lyase
MTEYHACSDATFIASVEGFEALPHLLRLLARGTPVRIDEIAALAERPKAEVERLLRSQPGTEWDDEGDVVGFGLTTRPTQNRYVVAGRTFYTWCASDTLMFTAILGKPAVAESTCPISGEAIRVELRPDVVVSVQPPDAVVSQRHRSELIADLRAEVCDHGHFFASPTAASGWAAAHPEGKVLSVAEAFEHGRQACAELGWLPEVTLR